jgi:hypothetical protein
MKRILYRFVNFQIMERNELALINGNFNQLVSERMATFIVINIHRGYTIFNDFEFIDIKLTDFTDCVPHYFNSSASLV